MILKVGGCRHTELSSHATATLVMSKILTIHQLFNRMHLNFVGWWKFFSFDYYSCFDSISFSNPLNSIHLMNFTNILKLNLCFTMNLCWICLRNSLKPTKWSLAHASKAMIANSIRAICWIFIFTSRWMDFGFHSNLEHPSIYRKLVKWHNIFPNSNQIYPVDGFIVNAISVSNIFSSPSANYANQSCVSLAVYSLVRFLFFSEWCNARVSNSGNNHNGSKFVAAITFNFSSPPLSPSLCQTVSLVSSNQSFVRKYSSGVHDDNLNENGS